MLTRRSTLFAPLAALALGSTPRSAFASQSADVRALRLLNLHTGESLEAEYWRAGAYAEDALGAINHILRDHRTNEAHTMDARLLDLLHELAGALGTNRPFQVISGYRSPTTNAALAGASSGVARRSLHMEGMAIDIAMDGVSTETVRDAALTLSRGGVGFYPNPGFVHVDVGRVRRW